MTQLSLTATIAASMVGKRKAADCPPSVSVPTDQANEKAAVESPKKRRKVVKADFKQVDAAELPLLKNSRLDLADSEFYYVERFVDSERAKRWYNELFALTTCRIYHTIHSDD